MEQFNFGVQLWDYTDVESLMEEFLKLYDRRPIADNRGGMLSTHLFWTWYVIKKLRPKYIIESGVYKGQGTYLMSNAYPEAKIFSIDPDLSQRRYINDEVTYYTMDFASIDWNKEGINCKETLCFFDDHQNAYIRLQQMKWMGFTKAIFEDNYPVKQGDCYSCKKVLSECGLSIDGKDRILANSVDAKYFQENVKTYIELPPLFKNKKTRWGDMWDETEYPTPEPVFTDKDIERYKVVKEEAYSYTWICFVELK